MPDCFISHSSNDKRLAGLVREELERHGVKTFLAPISLQPGERWSPAILENLRASNWVLVLASKAACSSAFVNQEIGAALLTSKTLVPIVWDVSPSELPGWLAQFQALDLRNATVAQLRQHVAAIAKRISQEKARGWLILGSLLAGLFLFGDES
jgi:hypothetical protein